MAPDKITKQRGARHEPHHHRGRVDELELGQEIL